MIINMSKSMNDSQVDDNDSDNDDNYYCNQVKRWQAVSNKRGRSPSPVNSTPSPVEPENSNNLDTKPEVPEKKRKLSHRIQMVTASTSVSDDEDDDLMVELSSDEDEFKPSDIDDDVDEILSSVMPTQSDNARFKQNNNQLLLELQAFKSAFANRIVESSSPPSKSPTRPVVVDCARHVWIVLKMIGSAESTTQTHKIGYNESFEHVFRKMADAWRCPLKNVVISFDGQLIAAHDTPESLSLMVVADRLLEFDVYEKKEDEAISSNAVVDGIRIKFQLDDKRKCFYRTFPKKQTFGFFKKLYAQELAISADRIVFVYDANRIDDDESPHDLDMEDDDCVDTTIIGI